MPAQASETRSPLGPALSTLKEPGVNADPGQVAANPEFQAQMKQQFAEMDYLDGPQWQEHLKQDDERLRKIWASTPWVE